MADNGSYSGCGDGELAKLTLRGDHEAYCELVRRHGAAVFRVIYRITGNYHESEDLTQDAFTDGYIRLGSLRDLDKVAAWLCGIGKMKALHRISRRRDVSDIDDYADFLADGAMTPDERVLDSEKRREIREAVDFLPPKLAQTARLFYLDGLTFESVANRLAVPSGTVKRRLFDARKLLKERLAYMNENKFEVTGEFVAEIDKKIGLFDDYYRLHDRSYAGLNEEAGELIDLIDKMPDSAGKQNRLATVYMRMYYANNSDHEYAKKAHSAAVAGKNGKILAEYFVEKLLENSDNKSRVSTVNDVMLPEMERAGCANCAAPLLVWRGRAELEAAGADAAYESFRQAAELASDDKSDIYYALALSAMRCIDFAREHSDNPTDGLNVIAESYRRDGGRIAFMTQPGFNTRAIHYTLHKMDCLNYFVSRFADECFFDTSMQTGCVYTDREGATLRVLSTDESVITAAGCFDSCMHLEYKNESEYKADIWYAPNVGMVRVIFSGVWLGMSTEQYELAEYRICGGDGYFPFAVGNRLRYVKTDMSDVLSALFEYECVWTDGVTANYIVALPVCYNKEYAVGDIKDSEIYVGMCDDYCQNWKVDDAITALKRAVISNTSQDAVQISLAGIPYLERFSGYLKNNYRVCPSSMNGSRLVCEGEKIFYSDSDYSFAPYRLGSRFEENRIFGVKFFRFLSAAAGCVFNNAWQPGYEMTSAKAYDGADTVLKVSDGGTITTKAGTFENCLKITVAVGITDGDRNYYFGSRYRNVGHGLKEYWFASGIGIVRFDCTWGDFTSRCELSKYSLPAADDVYLPVSIGNRWEYDEVNLTAEGYCAKRLVSVLCGMNGNYFIEDAQEFVYLGTETEYEDFKRSLSDN